MTAPDYTQVPGYVAPSVYYPALGTEALTILLGLVACNDLRYGIEVFEVDNSGAVLFDLTPFVVQAGNNTVTKDCTAEITTTVALEFSDLTLQWGSTLVQVYQLVSSNAFNAGQVYGFPVGCYVVTSPDIDLQPNSTTPVTGYEKTYLLQSSLGDSVTFAQTSTFSAGVKAMMVAAGLMSSGAALSTVADFPGDWSTKQLSVDLSYALFGDSTATTTYLDVINALLAASGCQPLFCDQLGNFQIVYLPVPANQSNQWTFSGSATDYSLANFPFSSDCVVSDTDRKINRDVYNVPNQWVFVQQGLGAPPSHNDGSDGRYVVNNTMRQPSDQTSVGRILRSTQFLNASGPADLVAQGDAIVTAQLSQGETITFSSTAWPVAWQYDVFRYTDATLPSPAVRKVQSQGFTLPLDGSMMSWSTVVVGYQT